MEGTQHYTKNTKLKWLIRKAFINDTILCVFHRQYKTIISALFVPNDNCSNEPGATYIEPGALGRLILGLGRIHKLSQNNLSVTFTYIVILFVIHWHPFVIVIPCHHPHCHFPTLLGPADRLIRFASLSEHHISTFETKRCCHQELINLDSTITKDWRMCTSLARSPKTS